MDGQTNTKFEDVYRLFLSTIHDYNLKKLFKEYYDVAEDLILTYLQKAIPKFYNCKKNIKNLDLENKCFYVSLDIDELDILSQLMVIEWWTSNINDIRQASLTLNDIDYKHYSEEKNLLGKSKYRNELREIVNQDIVQYGLNHTPFADWAGGNYEL